MLVFEPDCILTSGALIWFVKITMSFSLLPYEIRWKFWALIDDEPFTAKLCVKGEDEFIEKLSRPEYSSRPAPANDSNLALQVTVERRAIPLVLQLCHESRQYGLKIYEELNHGGHFAGYFNFSLDTLHSAVHLPLPWILWATNRVPVSCFFSITTYRHLFSNLAKLSNYSPCWSTEAFERDWNSENDANTSTFANNHLSLSWAGHTWIQPLFSEVIESSIRCSQVCRGRSEYVW